MICNVVDPLTKQPYPRDPRQIALKAEAYLASTGIADQAFFGAEAEFFIFDNVRFDSARQHSFYYIDSDEGRWNTGREEHNLGYRPRYKEGYFPVPPMDHYLGSAHGHGAADRSVRHRHRMPSPRSRHGRADAKSISSSTPC